jgi:hypothetical protein
MKANNNNHRNIKPKPKQPHKQRTNIKSTPKKILLVIVGAFVTFGGIYAGIEALEKIYRAIKIKYFYDEEYEKINKLDLDLSDEYLNELFGKPISKEYLDIKTDNDEKYRIDIYETKHCIINTLVNLSTNCLECYSVTIIDEYYKVFTNPLLIGASAKDNKGIGLFTLENISGEPEYISANEGIRWHHVNYYETHSFGMAGGLKYYQIGFNNYGYYFSDFPVTPSIQDEAFFSYYDNDEKYDSEITLYFFHYGRVIYNHREIRNKIISNQIAVFSYGCDENIINFIVSGGMGHLPTRFYSPQKHY